WGFDHAAERACDFVARLDGGYLQFHQPLAVSRQLLEAAQRADGQSDQVRAGTLLALGKLEVMEDNLPRARERYEAALRLYEAISARLGQANTLRALGELERIEGNYPQARQHYNQALALARQIPDTVCQLNCLIGLARLERALGDREAACAQYAALFALIDSLPAFANHPLTRDLKREAAALCSGETAARSELLSPEEAARLQGLVDRLIAWVQTPDWNASRAYLEEHQAELLTDDAEKALQMLIHMNPGRDELVQHLELLRKARREGIAAAYARIQSRSDLATRLLSGLATAMVEATPIENFTEEELEQLIAQAPTDDIREVLQRKLDEVRRRRGGA
ncbi:MAG: tetratricopeptide repeat protein, partial [Aggregatilineales bacterium]